MNRDKNKTIPNSIKIILGVMLIVIVFGISYAYFVALDESGTQTVTTKYLKLEFDNKDATIIASDIAPIYNDEVTSKAAKKTFTIKKASTSDNIYANIKLTNLNIPSDLAKYDLKWALYKGTDTKIATGDFGGKTSGSIVLATNQLINSTTGTTYNLYLWINETGLDQNAMMGETFSATINVSGTNEEQNTLANAIVTNGTKYFLGTKETITDFSKVTCDSSVCSDAFGLDLSIPENVKDCYERTSGAVCTVPDDAKEITNEYLTDTTIHDTPTISDTSQDKGLYVQQGDTTKSEMGFPTYYYRGNILGNYVNFANQIWRIVRINEDGSIKLITESPISVDGYNGVWNDDENYVNGYGTETETDSAAKAAVESWYNTNIGSNSTLDKKVVTSSFCNDISENYRAAGSRISSSTPIFTCPASSIIVYSKVGLITADEVMYSGAANDDQDQNATTKSYLATSSDTYTLTPAYNGIFPVVYFFDPTRGLNPNGLSGSSGNNIRAVVNLSADVIITGGDGLSADTAYTIG